MNRDKYIVVTGASSGLGNAVVQELSSRGYIVFAGVRKEEDNILFSRENDIFPVILDVAKPESIASAVEIIAERTNEKGLFALINNAGINYINAFELADEQKERYLFEVNLFGAMALTRRLLPLLHQFVSVNKSNARIINVSSIGGVFALPWESSYHASKFAMLGFSQSLRYEVEPLNISVCCFLPGGMKTNIFKKSIAGSAAENLNTLYSNYYKANLNHMNDVMLKFEKAAASPQRVSKIISKLLQKNSMPLKKYVGMDALFIRILSWLGLTVLLKGQFVRK